MHNYTIILKLNEINIFILLVPNSLYILLGYFKKFTGLLIFSIGISDKSIIY